MVKPRKYNKYNDLAMCSVTQYFGFTKKYMQYILLGERTPAIKDDVISLYNKIDKETKLVAEKIISDYGSTN